MRALMGKLLAVATALGAVLIMSTRAYANLEATCMAASAKDTRFNYSFCVKALSAAAQTGNGARELAKATAEMGAKLAAATEAKARARLEDPRTERKAYDPYQTCYYIYQRASNLFLFAEHLIDKNAYADAKSAARDVPSAVGDCDRYFHEAGLGAPFLEQSAKCEQLGIICGAITDLL
ncbi:hypothetical protein CFC21_073458 [Triticum aestivum]|uniref:Pectinesterase inhibitor domain-containing protein n=2 Tax=Triticum aestivum TaxID=4565 RepID=A0A3B6LSY6_WHEAT|nr:hypothetical protein CFC21_073458 [Triticum aestivum]